MIAGGETDARVGPVCKKIAQSKNKVAVSSIWDTPLRHTPGWLSLLVLQKYAAVQRENGPANCTHASKKEDTQKSIQK